MSFGNLHQHLCGILLIDNLNILHMQVNNVLMLVQNIMELDVFPPNLLQIDLYSVLTMIKNT